MGDLPVTPRGFELLQNKLRTIKDDQLPKVEQRLGAARELGDLSENSEFDAAREELWRLEQLIGELQDQLARAQVVLPSQVDQTVVSFGATVTLENLATHREETWTIVGHGEADVDQGRISVNSPLASGLVGAKSGELREIDLPAGKRTFKIVRFSYSE